MSQLGKEAILVTLFVTALMLVAMAVLRVRFLNPVIMLIFFGVVVVWIAIVYYIFREAK